jgi:D-glycero-beta-D-manno-heptose 1-phosphate adenylyltransferase
MIVTLEELPIPHHGMVVTNGCFDILHVGHVRYLAAAKRLGYFLMVGINDDAGVRKLKGPTRPVNSAQDRAEVINALKYVDYVCIFPGSKATEFLRRCRPKVYVKGGDYTLETLDKEETAVLKDCGADIRILPMVPGKSTTETIRKMKL